MAVKRSRLELQKLLEECLGVKHVYYQPPENLKMEYPAIRYSRSEIDSRHADDRKYTSHNVYEVIVIDEDPDNSAIQKILELPYSRLERHYVADNLNHDLIRLYY